MSQLQNNEAENNQAENKNVTKNMNVTENTNVTDKHVTLGKRPVTLNDGRYLIYYTFKDSSGNSGSSSSNTTREATDTNKLPEADATPAPIDAQPLAT